MNNYSIERENQGLEIIKQFPIIENFFGSPIKTFYETDCEEQIIDGADFQLENGKLIDLKSQLGYWKSEESKYYDSLVLSIERDQSCRYGQDNVRDIIWKDCLLSKKTDYWFYPVQTSTYFIYFYKINREQAEYIKNNYKLYTGMKGGKFQKYVIIPLLKFDTQSNRFIDNPDISKADFMLNLKLNSLINIKIK